MKRTEFPKLSKEAISVSWEELTEEEKESIHYSDLADGILCR